MDKRRLIIIIAISIAACLWFSLLLSGPRVLQVAFLDVGDGLCAVVRTPSGRVMVVDCGSSSYRDNAAIGRRLIAPYLQSMGANRIDVAVLTHPHADHVNGYPGLLQIKPADLVLDAGMRHGSPLYKDFLKAIRRNGTHYRTAKSGQTIDLGDGVLVHVLNPNPGTEYNDLNNQSAALRITYKHSSFLLAADTGAQAEQEMIVSGVNLHAQVLQVGHHGSRDGTTPGWIEAVRPEVAVISCARNSKYGFPSRQTVDRLQASGARVYATAKYGAVIAATDGNVVRIRTCKKPSQSY